MWQIQSIPTPLVWWPSVGNPDQEESLLGLAGSDPVAAWEKVVQDAAEDFTETTAAMADESPVAANGDSNITATPQTEATAALADGSPVADWENMTESAPDQGEATAALTDESPVADWEQTFEFAPDFTESSLGLTGDPVAANGT